MKRTFGLIGYPLTHSFSKKYFNEKFIREGKSELFEYENFEVKTIAEFAAFITSHHGLFGLNVTIPHKQDIIPFLDELNDEARIIGAVNTICIFRDEMGSPVKTVGYNTDATGFYQSVKPLLNERHSGALILGTGGASRAVKYVFDQLRIKTLSVSRFPVKGEAGYDQIDEALLKNYPVIVNTTPLGTFPDIDSAPAVPYQLLNENNLLFDLVYNPEETKFLTMGKTHGAHISNGYSMLVAQAEAAWKIWSNSF